MTDDKKPKLRLVPGAGEKPADKPPEKEGEESAESSGDAGFARTSGTPAKFHDRRSAGADAVFNSASPAPHFPGDWRTLGVWRSLGEWRKPVRFGLWIGGVGYLGGAYAIAQSILHSISSTAAIGLLFVPMWAIPFGLKFFAFGFCLGYLRTEGLGESRAVRIKQLVAAAFCAAMLAYGAWWYRDGTRLAARVGEIAKMGPVELHTVMADPRWNRNKYILNAVAENPETTSDILQRVAADPDEELYDRLGGSAFFNLLGKNQRGLAVMRLVAFHANVPAEALEVLGRAALAAENDYVLFEVARNAKTPEATLRKIAERPAQLVDQGVSSNPRAPSDLLTRYAKSADEYTRNAVAHNPSAPAEVLDALAKDPVWHVRQGVAMNEAAPAAVVAELASDANADVARMAKLRAAKVAAAKK